MEIPPQVQTFNSSDHQSIYLPGENSNSTILKF